MRRTSSPAPPTGPRRVTSARRGGRGTRSGISATAAPDRRLFGWPAGLAAALAAAAFLLGRWSGTSGAEQAVLAARYTARVSLGLFLLAYLIGPVARGSPARATLALKRQWARWLVAFLIAHLVHFATMLNLFAVAAAGARPRELMFGTMAYLLPLTAVATLSHVGKRYRRFRTLCLHFVWLSFLITYYHRLFDHPDRRAAGVFAFALLVAALAIRIVAAIRRR